MWHSLIPGSGKSTWVQEKMKTNPGVWCSRDAVRFSMVGEDEDYFARENEVYRIWINNIKTAIANKIDNIYIDATHLTKKARLNVLNKINTHNYNIIPICFELPLHICLQHNNQRFGRAKVPNEVIENMYNSYTTPNYSEFAYHNIIIFKEELFGKNLSD